jgi:DNA-binding protein H-NS
MPTRNLSSMSIDALLKLKADIEKALNSRAAQLRKELFKLGHGDVSKLRSLVGGSPLKGRKAPVKYRDRAGNNTWAGRGVQPKWLRAKLKAGAKLRDFAVKAKR